MSTPGHWEKRNFGTQGTHEIFRKFYIIASMAKLQKKPSVHAISFLPLYPLVECLLEIDFGDTYCMYIVRFPDQSGCLILNHSVVPFQAVSIYTHKMSSGGAFRCYFAKEIPSRLVPQTEGRTSIGLAAGHRRLRPRTIRETYQTAGHEYCAVASIPLTESGSTAEHRMEKPYVSPISCSSPGWSLDGHGMPWFPVRQLEERAVTSHAVTIYSQVSFQRTLLQCVKDWSCTRGEIGLLAPFCNRCRMQQPANETKSNKSTRDDLQLVGVMYRNFKLYAIETTTRSSPPRKQWISPTGVCGTTRRVLDLFMGNHLTRK